MSRRLRRNRSPAFKVKVALAAFIDDARLAELARKLNVQADQIGHWKK